MQLTQPNYKVLICGGKDYGKTWDAHLSKVVIDSYAVHLLQNTLANVAAEHPNLLLICSTGRGTDALTNVWAEKHNVQVSQYLLDLDMALEQRTIQLFEETKPDLLIAFPGGRCTASVVNRAKYLNIPIRVIAYEE